MKKNLSRHPPQISNVIGCNKIDTMRMANGNDKRCNQNISKIRIKKTFFVESDCKFDSKHQTAIGINFYKNAPNLCLCIT